VVSDGAGDDPEPHGDGDIPGEVAFHVDRMAPPSAGRNRYRSACWMTRCSPELADEVNAPVEVPYRGQWLRTPRADGVIRW
jgi:hypothetical protein